MTDFESAPAPLPARSTTWSLSDDAPADAPAVDTVAVPPRKRPVLPALLAAAAVVLVAAIVGGVVLANRDNGPTAAEVTAFCDAATRSMTGSTGFDKQLVDLAPDEIRADVQVVADNAWTTDQTDPAQLRRLEESGSRFLAWIETNCYPAAAQPGAAPADQRFAPVPLPDGTRPCFVTNGMPSRSADDMQSHVIVYGDPAATDPWSGPLLGLLTGVVAETATNSALQTTPMGGPPESTTGQLSDPAGGTIANSSDPHLAPSRDQRQHHAGQPEPRRRRPPGHRLPDRGLGPGRDPAGIRTLRSRGLYDGDLPIADSVLSGGAGATFSVSAGTVAARSGPGGPGSPGALWSGFVGDQRTVDATRLLIGTANERTLAGRRVLGVGRERLAPRTKAASARWAEPDGVVITATVVGADAPTKITDLVDSMRKLDREQWTDLTKQFSYCGLFEQPRRIGGEQRDQLRRCVVLGHQLTDRRDADDHGHGAGDDAVANYLTVAMAARAASIAPGDAGVSGMRTSGVGMRPCAWSTPLNTAGFGSTKHDSTTGRSISASARPSSTLPAAPHSIIETNCSVHTCADAQIVPAAPMSIIGKR